MSLCSMSDTEKFFVDILVSNQCDGAVAVVPQAELEGGEVPDDECGVEEGRYVPVHLLHYYFLSQPQIEAAGGGQAEIRDERVQSRLDRLHVDH